MTTRLVREVCERCEALRAAVERERAIHAAQRKILRVLKPLSPEKQRRVIQAAACLHGITL